MLFPFEIFCNKNKRYSNNYCRFLYNKTVGYKQFNNYEKSSFFIKYTKKENWKNLGLIQFNFVFLSYEHYFVHLV